MSLSSPQSVKSSSGDSPKLTFEAFAKLDLKQLQVSIIGTENEYGLSYTLYKIQVKHPQIQTFICSRRYNEFYALHKVLKMKYCNLDLPQFPSKHEWLFKTEKRKAGFHLFLNKLVIIAIQHPQIQGNILKFLYYFLTRDLLGNQKQSIFSSTQENAEDPDLQFRYNNLIPEDVTYNCETQSKLASNLELRFSDEENWQIFYCKISEGTLQLFQHISYNHFSCQIFLFQVKVEIQDEIIYIYHQYDYKKVQLRVPDLNLQKMWFSQLKFASQETLQVEKMSDDFHPIGKVQLLIKEAVNLSNLIQDSFLFVRVKFPPFLCQTKHHVYSNNPQWSQDFIMPIIDSFSVIQLELVNEIQDGLLKRKVKQQVIGTAELQIADLLSYHSGTKFTRLELPLEQGNDVRKPLLMVTIRNMSSPLSIFGAAPVFSYENEYMQPDLTVMKMNVIRFKRIISLIISFQLQLEDIVDQKYPRLTFLVFTFMFIFIYNANLNNILSYIGFILLFILVYQHPTIHSYVVDFFDKYILCELNKYYRTPQLFTQEEKDLKKNTQSLDKVIKFEGNEIKIEDDDENEAKESFYQKLRAIKKTFFIVQLQLTYMCNFAEKLINLFTWQEYHRTLWFLTIIIVLYCIISILPIRYMMLAGIINEWFDGRVVFKKRQMHNEKIATVMMEYIFKKHAPELSNTKLLMDVAFPKGDFRIKMANELLMHLQISMNQEEASRYNTGNEVIRDLGTCSQKLKWMAIIDSHFIRDQLYYELRAKGNFRMKPHYLVYYAITNFIYNIPSQYYRLRRPIQISK